MRGSAWGLVAALLAGCGWVVDADGFRGGPSGPSRDGGTPPLVVEPAEVHEGAGAGAPLVLEVSIPDDLDRDTYTVRAPGLVVVGVTRSEDGARLGLAVRAPVLPELGEGERRTLSIEIAELGRAEVDLVGHPEAQLQGEVTAATLSGTYSELSVRDLVVTGGAVELKVFGTFRFEGSALDLAASGPLSGPGGCGGGGACASDGALGEAGWGGGGGGGFGGPGADGQGSRGGRAGPVADEAAGAGGRGGDALSQGGGGGGRLRVDAGEIVGLVPIDARGGDGRVGPDCVAGGGGGGGGLVVLGAQVFAGALPEVRVRGGEGAGGMGCGRRGGDGGPGLALLHLPVPSGAGAFVPGAFDDPRVSLVGRPGAELMLTLDDAVTPVRLDEAGQGAVTLEKTGSVCVLASGLAVACVQRFVP